MALLTDAIRSGSNPAALCIPSFWFAILNHSLRYFILLLPLWGHTATQLVEALCYKPEGRGFDSRWGHWIFQLT
jgi:hypothetical protein